VTFSPSSKPTSPAHPRDQGPLLPLELRVDVHPRTSASCAIRQRGLGLAGSSTLAICRGGVDVLNALEGWRYRGRDVRLLQEDRCRRWP